MKLLQGIQILKKMQATSLNFNEQQYVKKRLVR